VAGGVAEATLDRTHSLVAAYRCGMRISSLQGRNFREIPTRTASRRARLGIVSSPGATPATLAMPATRVHWTLVLAFSAAISAPLAGSAVHAEPCPTDLPIAEERAPDPVDDRTDGGANRIDPRVDAARERITELPETEPPTRIVQPLPAFHRIAERNDDIAMSADATHAARRAMQRGLDHLLASQRVDGAWMADATAAPTGEPDRPTPVTVAVTALAIKAIAQALPESNGAVTRREADAESHEDASLDAVERAVGFLHRWRTDDASWGAGPLASYVNACVVMGLAATQDLRLRDLVEEGVDFLRSAQWDESEGVSPNQDWYGGAGYGRHGRPDLSNTQMMLDALHDAGVSADDPAVQRALAFVTRTQNLHETNPADWAQAGANDGGFVYTPANGGESFASEAAGEGRYGELRPAGAPRTLRSYGSMTYAGLKSLLYAGLDQDDPRVVAALGWIQRHLTFDENPGLGQQGLYYYLHAMARALVAAQQPLIESVSHDADDQAASESADHARATVNWREEMVAALIDRQLDDGGWRNDTTRWLEGEDVLATIYAILALQECLKPAPPLNDSTTTGAPDGANRSGTTR